MRGDDHGHRRWGCRLVPRGLDRSACPERAVVIRGSHEVPAQRINGQLRTVCSSNAGSGNTVPWLADEGPDLFQPLELARLKDDRALARSAELYEVEPGERDAAPLLPVSSRDPVPDAADLTVLQERWSRLTFVVVSSRVRVG